MQTLLGTPTLVLRTGPHRGRSYELGVSLRIGRHPYNEASIPDRTVSRYHCWIQGTDTGYFVEDLASANGTFVNEEPVVSRRRLRPGDVLRVGRTEILFTEEP